MQGNGPRGRFRPRACSPTQGARSNRCRRPTNASALIAGFGQDTVLGLRRTAQRLEFGRGPAGDGTVPLTLAHWPGLPDLVCRGKPRVAARQRGRRPGRDRPRKRRHDVGIAARTAAPARRADAVAGRHPRTAVGRRSPGTTCPSGSSANSCASSSGRGTCRERRARRKARRPVTPCRDCTSSRAASRRAMLRRSCSAHLQMSSRRVLHLPWTRSCTARSATWRAGARSAPPPAKCSCSRSAGAGSRQDSSCSPVSAISDATDPTSSGSPPPM